MGICCQRRMVLENLDETEDLLVVCDDGMSVSIGQCAVDLPDEWKLPRGVRTTVEPLERTAVQLVQCPLPPGCNRAVYIRSLQLLDHCKYSASMLLISSEPGLSMVGGVMKLSQKTDENWRGCCIFNKLDLDDLDAFTEDGFVIVNASNGCVLGMARRVVVAEDLQFDVNGGARTNFSFFCARSKAIVALSKKKKPGKGGIVEDGWVSVFSHPLVAKEHDPEF